MGEEQLHLFEDLPSVEVDDGRVCYTCKRSLPLSMYYPTNKGGVSPIHFITTLSDPPVECRSVSIDVSDTELTIATVTSSKGTITYFVFSCAIFYSL